MYSSYVIQLLPASVAWLLISLACFLDLVPINALTSTEQKVINSGSRLPPLLQNRFLHAILFLFFSVLVTGNGKVNIWSLPLLAISITIVPMSYGHQDSDLLDFVRSHSSWHLLTDRKGLMNQKTPLWLVANGLAVLIGLSFGCTVSEAFFGLLTDVIGISLYAVLSETIRGDYYSSDSDLKKQFLVPSTLVSACLAYISWIALRIPFPAGESAPILALRSFCYALAILLSASEGVALPTLATLTATATLLEIGGLGFWRFFAVVTLLFSIGLQISLSYPQSTEKRKPLLYYIVLPVIVISVFQLLLNSPVTTSVFKHNPHPMQTLHKQYLTEFEIKISKQSRTISQAVEEYKRRYGREPPDGFDRWFNLARDKEFKFIDEFDSIMASIKPFWNLPPSVMRERVEAASESYAFIKFQVYNGEAKFGPMDHYWSGYLQDAINKYRQYKLLPDCGLDRISVDFLVNINDEPRIVVADGKQTIESPNAESGDGSWIELSQQSLQSELVKACPASATHSPTEKTKIADLFVSNMTESRDFCQNPSLFEQHGFLKAPETFLFTRTLFPVLSQCKPMHFDDILFASPYYNWLDESDDLEETDDAMWEDKKDSIYWSGSSTGGHGTVENWESLHRQRLALHFTSKHNQDPVALLQHQQQDQDPSPNSFQFSTGSAWQLFRSTWSRLSPLFKIRLNRVVQCEDQACDEMESIFPVGKFDPVTESIASKLALDVDGNTFSGRFIRLLRSNSTVLKMTIFQEWHDDLLTPWVHYVPVSTSYDELGEIVRFLLRDEEGRELGKNIAEMGRDWSRKVFRTEDFELVNLRVLMELGRILKY